MIDTVMPVAAMPVVRTYEGYWIHPAIDKMLAGREGVETSEFNAWLEANGLESCGAIWGDEESPEYLAYVQSGSCAEWQPTPPEGDGWFLGSIVDSEDLGPECVWLRNKITLPTPDSRVAELEALVAELEDLLLVDVPETVWPAEVQLVYTQMENADALPAHHQHRLKFHINRMFLEGLALPGVIRAAVSVKNALEARQ